MSLDKNYASSCIYSTTYYLDVNLKRNFKKEYILLLIKKKKKKKKKKIKLKIFSLHRAKGGWMAFARLNRFASEESGWETLLRRIARNIDTRKGGKDVWKMDREFLGRKGAEASRLAGPEGGQYRGPA